MTLPAGVCVSACGLSIIIGGGGFVVGWNPGGSLLVIVNILVNGIVLVNRIGGGQLVNGIVLVIIGILLVIIIGGQFVRIGEMLVFIIGGPAKIPCSSHFSEPVTLPFTTVHSSLNVPSPATGACSLVVPCPVILLLIRNVIEWDSTVLRPSK
jgi:hypothetical protein